MIGVSRYTVAEYLRRAGVVGITWPVPPDLDDAALERRLFSPPFAAEPARPQPDWPRLHAELRRPGVTLLLVWEEYRAGQPEGYGYSRFCDLHAAWRRRLSPTMRQTHPAGERLFVDYAGQTVEVIDGATGEVRPAQIFVAALGASNMTYAEARWTQALPDWIGCHVGAFTSFGGVARQIVCDNLKSGVTATCRYEPGISRTYQDMASHYHTAILPGRVRRPRDDGGGTDRRGLAQQPGRRPFGVTAMGAWHVTDRYGKDLAVLRPGPPCLPRQSLRAVSARAPAAGGARPGPG